LRIFLAEVQTDPGAHPAPSKKRYQLSFLGVKQPGSGVDHPPPSSIEVKGVELYLYSLLGLHDLF